MTERIAIALPLPVDTIVRLLGAIAKEFPARFVSIENDHLVVEVDE